MTDRLELKAEDGRCEEASFLSRERYIPCNLPARFIVKNRDVREYRMCAACTDHNVRNRGGKIVKEYHEARMTNQESYEIQRKQAIENLEKLGLEKIPLDVAAASLPTKPEWAGLPKRRKKKG